MVDSTAQHPAFPQPENRDAILWRYMDGPKFEWLVENSRLFMPSVEHLGDPYEGSTPKAELDWWQAEAEKAENEDQRRIIEHNRGLLSRTALAFRTHAYCISCWHMNQNENFAMWKCYTTQPESVAIQTTYSALQICLPPIVQVGLMRYIDYATDRLPSMNMFEYIMHKRVHFQFEHEVRAVAFRFPPGAVGSDEFHRDFFESESNSEFLVYAPPLDIKQLIRGVVLSPTAPDDYRQRTIVLCEKNGLPTPRSSGMSGEPVF
jgi:hypothetical protein